ncbi:hypothetical protein [Falsiroseomonas stagni]|uniref:Uncharacterized protein n=1 Tax=Falsiroseomonas stagni DSM 19981 TaxID=1123062 RepID=A0A1I4D6G1_9PROT|nr:hypothetical protein [Falsiroseomonas stagni]SFK87571.1 hypothetical protein SAMN02745775_109100 [Falsiroseomonas stagni DSM 19981]
MKDMIATIASYPALMDFGLVAMGLLAGAGALTAWQRLHAWREQRQSEWDPY